MNHTQTKTKRKKKNNFVKFFEIRIREYLICLMGNVYAMKGEAVRNRHGAMN